MQIQCHHCGVEFAYKQNFVRHLQNIHNFVFEEAMIPKNGNLRIENVDYNSLIKVSSLTKAEFICV